MLRRMRLPALLTLALALVADAMRAGPVRAQPAPEESPWEEAAPATMTEPPTHRLHADEDDDGWLGCADEVLPFLEGVQRVSAEDGSSACRYTHTRHLLVGPRRWTLALERTGSEHEDHATIEESVYFLDEAGRAFAQVEQLDIEQYQEVSRMRVRRFRMSRFPDPLGYERPGLCIETVEELGAGSHDTWQAESEGRPWVPHRRHRAVDAWVIEDDTGLAPTLRRRAAYDGLCPLRGYARFVDAGARDMTNLERRRVVGETFLADAIQRPPMPWRAPWLRGQHLTVQDVRRAFPGHSRYWTTVAGTESSPEPHEPIVCAGRGRGIGAQCLVRITLLSFEERGRMGLMLTRGERFEGSIAVRDPGFATGIDGVRVGARYADIASRLHSCELFQGDFQGLICGVPSAQGLFVELEIRDPRMADCTEEAWSACPALDVARVSAIRLAPR